MRQITAAAHARVDAVVGGGLVTVGDYAAYLRGMHRFVLMSQVALLEGDLGSPRQWLEADLATLHVAPLPRAAPPPVDAHHAAQLGWEYVIAGAAVGARYLLRHALALGYSADNGACFLAGHAAGSDWPKFLARLKRANLCEHDLQHLGDGALAAFAIAESAFNTAQQSAPHE